MRGDIKYSVKWKRFENTMANVTTLKSLIRPSIAILRQNREEWLEHVINQKAAHASPLGTDSVACAMGIRNCFNDFLNQCAVDYKPHRTTSYGLIPLFWCAQRLKIIKSTWLNWNLSQNIYHFWGVAELFLLSPQTFVHNDAQHT